MAGVVARRDLLGTGATGALGIKPFGVGSETFVEPDITPVTHRDAVAEPLVSQLVHHHRDIRTGAEKPLTVYRAGLVLQRKVQARRIWHHATELMERVRTEDPGQEVQDLRRALHRAARRVRHLR